MCSWLRKLPLPTSLEYGGFRAGTQTVSSGGNVQGLPAGAVHLGRHASPARSRCWTQQGDGDGVADQWKRVPVPVVGLLACCVSVDEYDARKARIQQHESLHQPHQKSGTTLVDVHAERVVGQPQSALNDIAGRRDDVVRRLSYVKESTNVFLFDEPAIQELPHAEKG